MVQAQTQQTSVTKPSMPQPAPSSTDAVAQPMEGNNMKWWIWLIIALVVIGAGIGIYFLFM